MLCIAIYPLLYYSTDVDNLTTLNTFIFKINHKSHSSL